MIQIILKCLYSDVRESVEPTFSTKKTEKFYNFLNIAGKVRNLRKSPENYGKLRKSP